MEIVDSDSGIEFYGVGMDSNIVTASIKALLSGVNRTVQISQKKIQKHAA
jgi:2-isopropylmalate synthase